MSPIPQTLLSLIYHSTISRYRDEMHHDLQQAYRRFDLDESLAKLGLQGSVATEVRDAIEELDIAADNMRATGGSNAAATAELQLKSAAVFKILAPILAAEVGKGSNAPNQEPPAQPPNSLLAQLYFLLYSADYRAGAGKVQVLGDAKVLAAWNAVAMARDKPPTPAATLLPEMTTLCDQLRAEFDGPIWPCIW